MGVVARLDRAGLADLAAACDSEDVLARWRAKVVTVEGSSCAWWTGAVSGRGHGRFWLSSGRVVVAHRFAIALVHGAEAATAVPVLGHRFDNPLCQRVGPGHIVASSNVQNRREWAIRRAHAVLHWVIRARARQRARELRDMAREDPAMVAVDLARAREIGHSDNMARISLSRLSLGAGRSASRDCRR